MWTLRRNRRTSLVAVKAVEIICAIITATSALRGAVFFQCVKSVGKRYRASHDFTCPDATQNDGKNKNAP